MSKDASIYQAGMVPQGSRVIVKVSRGPQPGPVGSFAVMPEVVGKSQGAALEALAEQGVQAQVVYDYNDMLRKGSVMAQLPTAQTSIPSTSEAVVLVSSGEALRERPAVALPEVTGMNETQALNTLNSAGLSPQVVYEHSANVPAGVVIAQLPDRNTFSAMGTSGGGSKTALWVLIGILAIILLAIGAYFVMNSMTPTETKVAVPDVVGMQTEEATREILKAGLKVGTVTEVAVDDENVTPGSVTETDPAAQTEVAKDSTVDIKVAKTKTELKISIPDVVGQTQASATAVLQNAGFDVTVEQQASATVEDGTVISQNPQGGLDAPKGATVLIVVSTGPETQQVEVPDVNGLSESAARSTLTAAGLKMKKSEGSSDTVVEGNVISQVPAAGKNVDEGSTITVVISTGAADPNASGE